jgi:hypothetical protein
MSQKKPELKFKYSFADDYNPVYVNGAHGGLTPRGELVVNFYLERTGLPNAIIHEITPAGALGAEIAQEPADANNTLVRFIEAGIILNGENARIFHAWLGERIKELDSMEKAKMAAQMGTAAYGKDFTH